MSSFEKNFSYETLLENLRATHDSRKKRFEEKKHLLTEEDRAIERTLFKLEDDAFAQKQSVGLQEKDLLFNFDEFMNEVNGADHQEVSEEAGDYESCSTQNTSERRHVCPKSGCNKSYTSSHGLKYHMTHGHSKDKENVYKPFVCHISKCGKAYRNSNGLKYHMTKAHPKGK